jgi:hypothetical protein
MTDAASSPPPADQKIELPLWQCHKRVRAAKIVRVEWVVDSRRGYLVLDCGICVEVNSDYRSRCAGMTAGDLGYFVRYEDGHESWSPSKLFEEGYSRADIANLYREQASRQRDELIDALVAGALIRQLR